MIQLVILFLLIKGASTPFYHIPYYELKYFEYIYYHILNKKQVSIKIQKTILNYLNYFVQLRYFRFKATCQTEKTFIPID